MVFAQKFAVWIVTFCSHAANLTSVFTTFSAVCKVFIGFFKCLSESALIVSGLVVCFVNENSLNCS